MRAASRASPLSAAANAWSAASRSCSESRRNCSRVIGDDMRSGGGAFPAPPPRDYVEPENLCGSQRGAGLFGKRRKRRGVMDREVCENLAVDLDPGLLQAVHERAVAHVVLARARIDARDPEATEVALLVLAIAVRVPPAAFDGFLGGLPELAAATVCATGRLHDLLLPLQTRNVRSRARHWFSPPLCLKKTLHALHLAAPRDERTAAKAAFPLRRLLGENVALEGAAAADLSTSRDLEALPRAFVRFHLRHI